MLARLTDTHPTLVNPLDAIAPEAQAVHGLTLEQLADAPTFAALEPQLRTLLANKTVITYNVAFDYARFVGEPHTHGYRYQRLPNAGHRAVDDAQTTIELIERLAEIPLNVEEVGE